MNGDMTFRIDPYNAGEVFAARHLEDPGRVDLQRGRTDNGPTTVTAALTKVGDATSVELMVSPAVGRDDPGITLGYTGSADANHLRGLVANPIADFSG